MVRFSFTGVERASRCAPSPSLPQTMSTSPDAIRGTVLHKFLADVPALGVDAALALVPEEHRRAASIINLDVLPASKPDQFAAEVAFAYDPATGAAREIGRNIGRAYATLLGEIPGTLDVVGVTDEEVIVLDYKSGWADLGPAKNIWQLKIGVLAAARAYGKKQGRAAIVRLKSDGEAWFDWAAFSELDLDVFEDELRGIVFRVDDAQAAMKEGHLPPTTEGEHCKYCPAFNSCPSKVLLAVALGGAVPAHPDPFLPVSLNEENFPEFWERLQAAKKVLERVEVVLEDFTRIRPVKLADGQVIGPKPHPRDQIDAGITEEVLTELFDAEAAAVAVEVSKSTGKGRIEDALRDAKKRKPGLVIKKAKESVLAAIKERGGIVTTTSFPVSKHRPKELPSTTTPTSSTGEAHVA